MEIVLGILLVVLAAVVIAFVLMQSGKGKKLSGTITGGTDTFFSKGKSQTKEKKLARYTTVLAVVFAVIAVAAVLLLG